MFHEIGGWRGLLGCVLGCLAILIVVAVFTMSSALGWVILLAMMGWAFPRTGWRV